MLRQTRNVYNLKLANKNGLGTWNFSSYNRDSICPWKMSIGKGGSKNRTSI